MSWSNPVPNYAGRMFDPNPFGAASRPAAVAPPAQPVRHSRLRRVCLFFFAAS